MVYRIVSSIFSGQSLVYEKILFEIEFLGDHHRYACFIFFKENYPL